MLSVEESAMFTHRGRRFLELIQLMTCHPALAGTLVQSSSSHKVEAPRPEPRTHAENVHYAPVPRTSLPLRYRPRI